MNVQTVSDFGAIGDGINDDTAAIQAAFNAGVGEFPAGVFLVGGLVLRSNTVMRGRGKGRTVLKLKPHSNTTLLNCVGAYGNRIMNVKVADLTLDGNAAQQDTAFYISTIMHAASINYESVEFKNPWSTTLWVNENDIAGSGPSGRPSLPNGQYFNTAIVIDRCTFNGDNQRDSSGDQVVFGRVDRGTIKDCLFTGAGANLLAVQFVTNVSITRNDFRNFWRGIYLETVMHSEVSSNSLSQLGTSSPLIGNADAFGIWATTADESYSGGGYAGCQYVNIYGNFLHELTNPHSGGKLHGISVNAGGRFVSIEGNKVVGIRGAWAAGINMAGPSDSTSVVRNDVTGCTSFCILLGTQAAGNTNLRADQNRADSANYGLYQEGNGHAGLHACGNNGRGNAVASFILQPPADGQAAIVAVNNQS